MSKKIVIIAATSLDGVIGIDEKIPWRIPEDFKHFRETTMGHTLVVGYKTYLTLPPKAFDGRKYLILNSDIESDVCYDRGRDDIPTSDVVQFKSINVLMEHVDLLQDDEIFIIGGESVYNQFINECDECIITLVNKTVPNGNKLFPIGILNEKFYVYEDYDWCLSSTGTMYKIMKYIKK